MPAPNNGASAAPSWWRNRIVGHGDELVSQIVNNPGNWKIHPKEQLQAIAASVQELGYFRSGTMNVRTGNLVDGHARALVLDYHGIETMPMEYIDVSEDEERAILLLIDPLAGMAVTDKPKLDALLHDVHLQHEHLVKAAAQIAEEAGLYFGKQAENQKPGTTQEPAQATSSPATKRYMVLIRCANEAHQHEVYDALSLEYGDDCRMVGY